MQNKRTDQTIWIFFWCDLSENQMKLNDKPQKIVQWMNIEHRMDRAPS